MLITEEIENIKKEIEQNNNKIKYLEKLFELFPDIQVNIDRFKTKRYFSKSVNAIAVDCDITYACRCCSDSELIVRAYVKTEYGIVFVNPSSIGIGEKGYNRDTLYKDWQKYLTRYGLSQDIVDKVKEYIKKQKEEYMEELKDKYEELTNDVD